MPPTGSRASCLRVLVGCFVAAGAVALFLVGAAIALRYWLLAPGRQVPSEALLSEDTVAALRVGDLGREDSVAQMLAGAAARLEPPIPEAKVAGAGAVIRWVTSLRRQPTAKDMAEVKSILPRDATVALEVPRGAGSPRLVGAVNLRGYPKLFRGIFWLASKGKGDDSRRVRGAGGGYYLLPRGAAVAFEGGTVVISGDAGAMPATLSRLRSPREGLPPEASLFDPGGLPPGGWDLYAGLDNRSGTLQDLIGRVRLACPEAASGPRGGSILNDPSAIGRLRAGLRAAGPDELEGKARIECRDELAAKALLARAQVWSGCLVALAREEGFEAEITHRTGGRDVEGTFRLRRAQAGLAHLVERFLERAQEREADP